MLVCGVALGGEITGGVLGVVALYLASVAFCAVAALWGMYMAVTFRTQQAGPLMQQGVFLAVFLSTAYTPQPLLRGWLADAATLNPVTHVLELGRQATVAGIEFIATAARHFSGRGFSRDETLWSSWVIAGPTRKAFYSGDTGYFPGFAAIGADTAGVAAGGLVAWRTGSIVACVIVAAAVTAGLRAL